MCLLGRQIVLYTDDTGLHAVATHRPYCIAGHRWRKIPMKVKARTGLAAAILCNVARALRGESFLTATDMFSNPINGMLAYQTMYYGYHAGGRQCAVAYKEFVSDKDTFAMKDHNLAKMPTSNHPVSVRLQYRKRQEYRKKKSKDDVRPEDQFICQQACCILSRMQKNNQENHKQIFTEMKDFLYKTPVGNNRSRHARLTQLMNNYIVRDSKLDRILQNLWKNKFRRNKGNKYNYAGRSPRKETQQKNQKAVQRLVKSHAEPSKPFWIKEFQGVNTPITGTLSNCGKYKFGVDDLVFHELTRDGLKSHFRAQTRRSNNTEAGKVEGSISSKLHC